MRPEVARYVAEALRAQERRHLLRAIASVMLGRRSLVERLALVHVPALFVATAADATWAPGRAYVVTERKVRAAGDAPTEGAGSADVGGPRAASLPLR